MNAVTFIKDMVEKAQTLFICLFVYTLGMGLRVL
jgi:hypothetical protein